MTTTTKVSLATQDEILAALQDGKITAVDAGKRIAALQSAVTAGKITIKVRPKGVPYKDAKGNDKDKDGNPLIGKGNVLVYGLQRWPVSFYAGQWQVLLGDETRNKILAAIEEHKDQLDWK